MEEHQSSPSVESGSIRSLTILGISIWLHSNARPADLESDALPWANPPIYR